LLPRQRLPNRRRRIFAHRAIRNVTLRNTLQTDYLRKGLQNVTHGHCIECKGMRFRRCSHCFA
jgi:hypothetical protein